MMKRLLLLLAAAAFFAACSSAKEVDEPVEPSTPEAAKRLETLCEELNGDLATLYTLVAADELPDCVVNVAPIAPDGETIGYGVSFKQNGAVTLYLDPDAAARKFVPQFGVYEADGIRYWAMNGQPLPSATGAPVPVVNDEGTVPRLKAEKGYWHISVDGGKNWWPAGLAPDGKTELATMPLVSQVTEEAEAWSIVLADGETALSIPKEGTLHIAVDAEEPLTFQPHEIRTVHYTITGGGPKTVVTAELEEPDGSYTMQVTPTDAASGSVAITAQVLYNKNILVTATDGSRTATATIAVTLRPGVDGTTVTVETPGKLASLLNKFDKNAITELTVGGNLNSTDIKTLKNLPNLAVLDLESANLKTLPDYAFDSKKSLTAVKLPKVLKKIGIWAFRYCDNLTSITIPESVTSIGQAAFMCCSNLTGELVIPQGVTSIGEYAFEDCSSLTGELVIPQGVTTIEDCAFYKCSSLTSLTILQGVTSIGTYAFKDCSSLTGELVIPQGVTSIGVAAFEYCSSLTSLTIPDSVTTIGERAFSGCRSLTGELVIPPSVTSIEKSAFSSCKGLTSVTIPQGVTMIGAAAFDNCSGLTGELVIPQGVTSIGDGAFYDCSGLISVTIPQGVTMIGSLAFYNCSGLTGELVIPESMASIGESAFSGCKGLTSVTIPQGVTSIGDRAFSNCTGLTAIYCKATVPPKAEGNSLIDTKVTLYVPVGTAEAYKAADIWKEFSNIIEMEF